MAYRMKLVFHDGRKLGGQASRLVRDFRGRGASMRLTSVSASMGLSLLASAACAQAAPPPDGSLEHSFPHAFAMRGCTQEDAPALEIYFTQTPFAGVGDPSPSYIRVEISSSPAERMEPASYSLTPVRRDPTKPGRVVRAELVESPHTSKWLTGTLTLTEVKPGQRVSGHYAFTTQEGRRLDSSFTAEFSNRSAVCG